VEAIRSDPQCRMGAKGVSSDAVSDFRFTIHDKIYMELAPITWSLICGICGVHKEEITTFFQDSMMDDLPDISEYLRDPHLEDDTHSMGRQKTLILIITIGMLMFARSR